MRDTFTSNAENRQPLFSIQEEGESRIMTQTATIQQALFSIEYTNNRSEIDKRLTQVSLLASGAADRLSEKDPYVAALLNALSDLADLASMEVIQERSDIARSLDALQKALDCAADTEKRQPVI